MNKTVGLMITIFTGCIVFVLAGDSFIGGTQFTEMKPSNFIISIILIFIGLIALLAIWEWWPDNKNKEEQRRYKKFYFKNKDNSGNHIITLYRIFCSIPTMRSAVLAVAGPVILFIFFQEVPPLGEWLFNFKASFYASQYPFVGSIFYLFAIMYICKPLRYEFQLKKIEILHSVLRGVTCGILLTITYIIATAAMLIYIDKPVEVYAAINEIFNRTETFDQTLVSLHGIGIIAFMIGIFSYYRLFSKVIIQINFHEENACIECNNCPYCTYVFKYRGVNKNSTLSKIDTINFQEALFLNDFSLMKKRLRELISIPLFLFMTLAIAKLMGAREYSDAIICIIFTLLVIIFMPQIIINHYYTKDNKPRKRNYDNHYIKV